MTNNEIALNDARKESERLFNMINLERITSQTQLAALTKQNETLRALVEEGLTAISAAYAQCNAEYQQLEKTADKHGKIVEDWRAKAKTALAQSQIKP